LAQGIEGIVESKLEIEASEFWKKFTKNILRKT
jgi:hypothetical protein